MDPLIGFTILSKQDEYLEYISQPFNAVSSAEIMEQEKAEIPSPSGKKLKEQDEH